MGAPWGAERSDEAVDGRGAKRKLFRTGARQPVGRLARRRDQRRPHGGPEPGRQHPEEPGCLAHTDDRVPGGARRRGLGAAQGGGARQDLPGTRRRGAAAVPGDPGARLRDGKRQGRGADRRLPGGRRSRPPAGRRGSSSPTCAPTSWPSRRTIPTWAGWSGTCAPCWNPGSTSASSTCGGSPGTRRPPCWRS